jgi:hypothetical protein
VQIYFENIQPEVVNQNATIELLWDDDPWGFIDQLQGKYYLKFILEAQDATQLGIGQMMLNLTINDTNGHLVMSSSKDHNIDLEGKDFVLLLGLEWIYIPSFDGSLSSGLFTFGYGSDNATEGYTFRVAVGSSITIGYRIYALENPGQVSVEWQNIYWRTPWNTTQQLQGPLNSTSYVNISVSSNQIDRWLFIAYVDGNEEKQLSLSPSRIYLEWDRLEAGTSDVDDDDTDLNNSILNIDGNYTLTYNTQFSSSGFNAAGSIFNVSIILWQFNGVNWVEFNRTSFFHLDGSKYLDINGYNENFTISFYNGTKKYVGFLNVIDTGPLDPNDADGRIDFQFQFNEVVKVKIIVSATEEAKSSGKDFRYYPSYYPESVFSYVNETSATLFEETIIWTKFKVQMRAADDRIPVLTGATIFISAYYAHDPSLDLTGVRVNILDNNLGLLYPSDILWLNNEVNYTNLISLGVVEKVTYTVSYFDDNNFGVSVFEGNVKVDIIWDQIIFEIGFPKPWSSLIRFNVNESAFVEIIAYYDYDKTPFSGTIYLQHGTTFSDTSTLFMGDREWNKSVTVPIPPQYSTSPGNSLFLIDSVISDKYGLNGTQEGQGYRVYSDVGSRWLILRWDRIIVDFTPDKGAYNAYNPGDPLNVSLSVFYESDGTVLNSTHFEYTLYKDGFEFLPNRSSLFFTDHEMYTTAHTYHIEWSHDFITGLNGTYSSGAIKEPKASITIEWKDRLAPILVEEKLIDFGNGTVGVYVLTTDDISGRYFGSGLESVTAQLTLPGNPPGDIIQLSRKANTSYGIVFYGSITTDPDDSRNHFIYNTNVTYNITLTDIQGNSLPVSFSKRLGSDSAAPSDDLFLIKFSPDQDGNLTILVNASDIWSGLAGAEIRFKNPQTGNWSTEFQIMNSLTLVVVGDTIYNATYSYNYLFNVGDRIDYEIRIFDNVGNIRLIEGTIDVTDESGPQLLSGNFEYTIFGDFSIDITIGDNGSSIISAALRYTIDEEIGLINLTEVLVSGGGSSLQKATYRYEKMFIGKFNLPPDLLQSRTVEFSLILTDSEGNERVLSNDELSPFIVIQGFELGVGGFELPSIGMDLISEFWGIIIGLLLVIAFLAVRQFRTVGGFDKKKVLADLDDISDTEVWEENDNISIGLIASFFDQVKGPVPIIFYPEKLRSSEAMLATLADRSFSTLGFVPSPEEDKHATFRFQVGGEKCTVFGYAFAFPNPEARGGQENLSLCFLIRPPWGNLENINRFLNELLDQLRPIRRLMQEESDVKLVEREMQNTRNFFTRALLTFRKKYKKEFIE